MFPMRRCEDNSIFDVTARTFSAIVLINNDPDGILDTS